MPGTGARRRRGLAVLGTATLAVGLVTVLAMAVLAVLMDVRVRAGRMLMREQRAVRPLLMRVRRTRTTGEEALGVFSVVAPGIGTVVLVRRGLRDGAVVYEGPPERAARVWQEGERRARRWAQREAARIEGAGGLAGMLARAGLDARAVEVIAGAGVE